MYRSKLSKETKIKRFNRFNKLQKMLKFSKVMRLELVLAYSRNISKYLKIKKNV